MLVSWECGKGNLLRVAYLTPLPPQQSGIADYSLELLTYLSRLVEITVFAAHPDQTDEQIRKRYNVLDLDQFSELHEGFDLALYHIGNSEHHDTISELALQFPGVIVLHDFYLHHSVALRTLGKGDWPGYAREMGYAAGSRGVRRAAAVKQGWEPPLYDVPLNRRLLDVSLGVIVHSHYTANLVRRQRYEGPIAVIPHQMSLSDGQPRRDALNLPRDAVLFGSFGLLTKEKQIIETLHALHALRKEMPQAHYLLVGEALPELALAAVVRELQLEEAVHRVGYVSELPEFIDWMATADVAINLRDPTAGETSGTALRAMAAGRPLIVSDQGWYGEIPAGAALKIPPGNKQDLLDAMRKMAGSELLRSQMGAAGRQYVFDTCRPMVAAANYLRELERIQRAARIYG